MPILRENVPRALLIVVAATKHHPDPAVVDRAGRRVGLVPCQLLPHGTARLALRRSVRRQQANRMDERLMCETTRASRRLVRMSAQTCASLHCGLYFHYPCTNLLPRDPCPRADQACSSTPNRNRVCCYRLRRGGERDI